LAKVVEVGDLAAEDGTALTSVAFSSCTSSSSSESLRMIILPSLDGPRMSRLRSPNSLLVNASSHKTSTMRSPSSEDEEISTTGALPEDPLALTSVSGAGVMKFPAGTSMAAVIQMASTVESWHRLAMGSPLWRESERVWCLSCPPLLASREQERRTIKASEKEKRTVRWLSAQDGDIYSQPSVVRLQ
jgi:hypothetical protein